MTIFIIFRADNRFRVYKDVAGWFLVTQNNEMLQVLTPDGNRIESQQLDPHLQNIDLDFIAKLYTDMKRVRRFDEESFALTRQGELTLWPPLLGQEASQVGSFHAFDERDWIFGSYREHAAPLLRGADFKQWMSTWKAHEYGGWDPHELNIGNMQIIIGAQSLHAVGYSMGAQHKKLGTVSATYFGDGATSEGDVNEALVFASAYNAPTVFICQNNGYAISEPVTVQANYPLYLRARGFNVPSMQVDGNDVLAVFAATSAAVERARKGGGPTFIETITYRMGPHTTTDDPTKYRTSEEVEGWRHRDPILRIEKYLAAQMPNFAEVQEKAEQLCDEMAAQMRAVVTSLQAKDPEAMFENVFVEKTAQITKQEQDHKRLIASLGSK